jgi:hypothetical protein
VDGRGGRNECNLLSEEGVDCKGRQRFRGGEMGVSKKVGGGDGGLCLFSIVTSFLLGSSDDGRWKSSNRKLDSKEVAVA